MIYYGVYMKFSKYSDVIVNYYYYVSLTIREIGETGQIISFMYHAYLGSSSY